MAFRALLLSAPRATQFGSGLAMRRLHTTPAPAMASFLDNLFGRNKKPEPPQKFPSTTSAVAAAAAHEPVVTKPKHKCVVPYGVGRGPGVGCEWVNPKRTRQTLNLSSGLPRMRTRLRGASWSSSASKACCKWLATLRPCLCRRWRRSFG